jgi:hypothetical protein
MKYQVVTFVLGCGIIDACQASAALIGTRGLPRADFYTQLGITNQAAQSCAAAWSQLFIVFARQPRQATADD